MSTLYYGDNLKILRDDIKDAFGWFGLYAFLIALLLSVPVTAQEILFANGKDARHIPFELSDRNSDNHIYLQVSANGSGPFRFMLDTGASHSFLAVRTAQRLGLSLTEIGKVGGGIGDDPPRVWDIHEPVSLDLPGVRIPGRKMVAVKTDGAEKCINRSAAGAEPRLLDGVLGADIFSDLVVSIDYKRKLIDLYTLKTFRNVVGGKAIEFNVEKTSGYILARIAVKGTLNKKSVGLSVVIDTGAGDTLTLSPLIWKSKNLAPPADVTRVIRDCGVGGDESIPTLVGDLAWLKIGDLTLDRPVTRFSQTWSPEYHDGILGNAALRNFDVVVFDYHNNRMIVIKP